MLYALALLLAFLGQILDVGYLFHFIFFAVAALPFLGLAVSLPAMLGCRAELGGSAARIQRGENASWFLRLTNRFRLPVARVSCRLRLTNRLTGQVHRVKTVIRGAAPEEECRWKLETDHCGILDFQTERLWAWDCLGLFALPVGRSAPASLTIAPLPEHPGAVELPEDAGAPVPRPGGKAVFGETYELRPYREAAKAERKLEQANVNVLYQKHIRQNPQLASNPVSRWQQKRAIRKQYAAAKRAGQSAGSTVKTAENVAKAAKKAAEETRKTAGFLWRHKKGFLIVIGLFLVVCIFLNGMSSCSMLAEGVLSVMGGSTHPSSDEAMLGAEAAYAGMENELQSYLDSYESTHDYDEYSYDLDEIGHDPYVLMALLNAYHWGGWTLEQVQGTLEMLFERQYTLTETVTVETRYDEDDEPYEYSICTVTLDNFDLSHLPIYLLDEEGMNIYAVYIATLGNRPDLFPASEYPNVSQRQDYLDYDVPPEALEDEVFAAMLAEAEKYLGYPYVWGGSSPSTSFDCSGFVSWVINHSGWNYGRLGAQGLCNICTPVSPANARPGDLVFFKYTYNAPNPDGVTHCGIYVGKVIPPIPDRARSR